MGLQQTQADAINLREKAKSHRQRAADELQKVAQYKLTGEPSSAEHAHRAVDQLNQRADDLDKQAADREEEATQLQAKIDQVNQEINDLEQQLDSKRRELQELEGRTAFSLF